MFVRVISGWGSQQHQSFTPQNDRTLAGVIERVIDGETGFIRSTDIGFADAAVQLLKDDALWQRQHDTAIKLQRALRWSHAAASFEALIQ